MAFAYSPPIVVAFVEREGSEDSNKVDRSRDASKVPRASSHGGSIADLPISLSVHPRLSFRPRKYHEIMKTRCERERKRDRCENGDANNGQQKENCRRYKLRESLGLRRIRGVGTFDTAQMNRRGREVADRCAEIRSPRLSRFHRYGSRRLRSRARVLLYWNLVFPTRKPRKGFLHEELYTRSIGLLQSMQSTFESGSKTTNVMFLIEN